VVVVAAPDDPPLLGLLSRIAPVIISGNTAVVTTGGPSALAAVTLAEVLATSDVPGGVVNVLTGDKAELLPWALGHMDVNSVDLTGEPNGLDDEAVATAADNVKRIVRSDPVGASPYMIGDFLEMKTVWHPIGR